jgi:hypothetical protein
MASIDHSATAAGAGLASGLVISALFDTLIKKGILTHDEAATVVKDAIDALGSRAGLTDGVQALRVLGHLSRNLPNS